MTMACKEIWWRVARVTGPVPYPSLRVRVLKGRGKGTGKYPEGYPGHTLSRALEECFEEQVEEMVL